MQSSVIAVCASLPSSCQMHGSIMRRQLCYQRCQNSFLDNGMLKQSIALQGEGIAEMDSQMCGKKRQWMHILFLFSGGVFFLLPSCYLGCHMGFSFCLICLSPFGMLMILLSMRQLFHSSK